MSDSEEIEGKRICYECHRLCHCSECYNVASGMDIYLCDLCIDMYEIMDD